MFEAISKACLNVTPTNTNYCDSLPSIKLESFLWLETNFTPRPS